MEQTPGRLLHPRSRVRTVLGCNLSGAGLSPEQSCQECGGDGESRSVNQAWSVVGSEAQTQEVPKPEHCKDHCANRQAYERIAAVALVFPKSRNADTDGHQASDWDAKKENPEQRFRQAKILETMGQEPQSKAGNRKKKSTMATLPRLEP
jgi:hypothetical protein